MNLYWPLKTNNENQQALYRKINHNKVEEIVNIFKMRAGNAQPNLLMTPTPTK